MRKRKTKYNSSNGHLDKTVISNMKISKFMRRNANLGCNICPECGETKYIYTEGNEIKGISKGMLLEWHEGFFPRRIIRSDCYNCLTCGARWESQSYQCLKEG